MHKIPKKFSKSDKKYWYLEKRAYENFLWFPGFPIYSMAKNEKPEMPEINIKLSKLKTPIVNGCNY